MLRCLDARFLVPGAYVQCLFCTVYERQTQNVLKSLQSKKCEVSKLPFTPTNMWCGMFSSKPSEIAAMLLFILANWFMKCS